MSLRARHQHGLLTTTRSWFAGCPETDLATIRTHLWPGNGGSTAGLIALGVFLWILLLSCLDHQVRAAASNKAGGGSWSAHHGCSESHQA